MKVGTDGTLLGAWARGGQRILDVGTGTGLIALMLAQRLELGLELELALALALAEGPAYLRYLPLRSLDRLRLPQTHQLVPVLVLAQWLALAEGPALVIHRSKMHRHQLVMYLNRKHPYSPPIPVRMQLEPVHSNRYLNAAHLLNH